MGYTLGMGRKATGLTKNPEMGARARARREALGLTKQQLADVLEVGLGRLNQMETDGVEGLTLIRSWANALGMDPQDLAFGTPEPDLPVGFARVKRETLAETLRRYPAPKKKKERRA